MLLACLGFCYSWALTTSIYLWSYDIPQNPMRHSTQHFVPHCVTWSVCLLQSKDKRLSEWLDSHGTVSNVTGSQELANSMKHSSDFPVAQMVKNLSAMQETWVWSLGWEDTLEKRVATHFSILAWRIPWTEDPGRLHSMGSQRVGHDWVTNTSICFRHSDWVVWLSRVVIMTFSTWSFYILGSKTMYVLTWFSQMDLFYYSPKLVVFFRLCVLIWGLKSILTIYFKS